MTIEAIILWIGATVSLTLQYVSWENCHSSLQWVGWLNSETLRIIIEQSDWVTVRRHCNTFWHFMINFQVFGKSCLDALLIRNKIKIAVILWFSLWSDLHSLLVILVYLEIKLIEVRIRLVAFTFFLKRYKFYFLLSLKMQLFSSIDSPLHDLLAFELWVWFCLSFWWVRSHITMV